MLFLAAIKHGFASYATLRGRVDRPGYWWWVLFSLLVSALVSESDALGLLVAFGLFLPSFGLFVRRLHDTDRSGWFMLLLFVPALGPFILLFFLLQPGTEGSNRFGPPFRLQDVADAASGGSGRWDETPPPTFGG
jgi:uncharacterized membrane protein YhaH (DUF805 family)